SSSVCVCGCSGPVPSSTTAKQHARYSRMKTSRGVTMINKRIDEPTGTETVGHEWDGIEELDTPMPRWWLWTLYLPIVWGVVYVILYPAWPLVDKATEGVLGWSSRGELAEEMSVVDQARVTVREELSRIPIE